jgi:hypothetical protein
MIIIIMIMIIIIIIIIIIISIDKTTKLVRLAHVSTSSM